MNRARTAVLALAALLASCSSQPRREAPEPAVPAAPPPAGITFAAVGDVMMGTDYPENILPDDDGVGFLSGVAPVLSAADVAFGNLEGVLMDGGEAVKRCNRGSKHKKIETTRAAPSPASPPPPLSPAPAAPPPATAAPSPPQPAAAPPQPVTAPPQPVTAPPQPVTAPPEPVEPPPGTSPADPQRGAPPELTGEAPMPEGEGEPPNADAAAEGHTAAAAETDAQSTPPSAESTTSTAREPAAPAEQSPATHQASSGSTIQPPGAPVTIQAPATSGSCYVFRSPTRYATYLRDAGFDVMSLANNHAQDFGDAGRDSSMRALDDVGIRHSGREGDVAEWTVNGRSVALVAFAPNIGSHQLNDLPHAREIVASLAAHHDIVIVSFHGGGEGEGASALPFAHEIYQGEDRGNVVEFAHAVIDAGADLVIGHGPHVLRAMELYRDRLIAYSLGNFATYYGISVNGIRGIAGILTTRLAADGRFLEAQLDSTIQIRPAGPTLDPEHRALLQLRQLTTEAFPYGALVIAGDGRITRAH